MITAIVTFPVPEPLDLDAAIRQFSKSAPNYQREGLQRKHFLRADDGTTVGGVYFWESREAADAFYSDEWRQSITTRFGAPTVEYFDVPVTVDADSIATHDGSISVNRFVAAPPATVYGAITDITRMGEWSPEVARSDWCEGFDSPAVGARYVGHNELGDKAWSIEAEILELVQNERFTFECISSSTGQPFAKWGYVIEPAEGGCRVTEWTKDDRTDEQKARGAAAVGVVDRVAHNTAGMKATLDRLAAACEENRG